MNVDFIRPFIEGTMQTLKTQCSCEAKPQRPYLKGSQPQKGFEIAAIIGVTSPHFTGSINLCFPEKVYLGLLGKMLGEVFPTLTKELEDGAAELLNIIFGQAKIVLNEKGMAIEKAIPTVIRGQGITTQSISKSPATVVPFGTEFGDFEVEIASEGTHLA